MLGLKCVFQDCQGDVDSHVDDVEELEAIEEQLRRLKEKRDGMISKMARRVVKIFVTPFSVSFETALLQFYISLLPLNVKCINLKIY